MANAEKERVDMMTRDLRELVAELMKTNPDAKNVKRLTEKTGIDYSEDPIELMSTVLKAINSVCNSLRPRFGGRVPAAGSGRPTVQTNEETSL